MGRVDSLAPRVGIDLGTTFCSVAWVNQAGEAEVIPDSFGNQAIPSVICFNGREAYVGAKACERKATNPNSIYEFVKCDIGKPVQSTGSRHEGELAAAPYEVGGYKYGAAGMSAMILRYLKKQAVRYFRGKGLVSESDDRKVMLDAIITVPAYFGDIERQETRLAGKAAGLRVVGMICEPTAAAVAYGLTRRTDQLILVVDLGGGTFDVTLLEMRGGKATVLATRGDNSLGGKDFDQLIRAYIYHEAHRQTGQDVEENRGFEIQQLAIQAKHKLSEDGATEVVLTHADADLTIPLWRRPAEALDLMDEIALQDERFYFEERSRDLLNRCRALCEAIFDKASAHRTLSGRQIDWVDIDEIVLAGGSCRMPMIADMIERLSGRQVKRRIEGFSYETAIAVGAALYGDNGERVQDVLSHGVGVRVLRGDRPVVDCMIARETRLPADADRMYRAKPNAVLEVYEGDSDAPDECRFRGRLELDNPAGNVRITINATEDGLLRVVADYPPHGKREQEIKNDGIGSREAALRERIQSLTIHA